MNHNKSAEWSDGITFTWQNIRVQLSCWRERLFTASSCSWQQLLLPLPFHLQQNLFLSFLFPSEWRQQRLDHSINVLHHSGICFWSIYNVYLPLPWRLLDLRSGLQMWCWLQVGGFYYSVPPPQAVTIACRDNSSLFHFSLRLVVYSSSFAVSSLSRHVSKFSCWRKGVSCFSGRVFVLWRFFTSWNVIGSKLVVMS